MEELRELGELPLWLLIVMPVVLIAQGTWLFIDARKRGSYPWFWGIWGLINVPTPLILYLIFVRTGWFGRRKKENSHE